MYIKMELTIENIINRLSTSGEGTKREVLNALKNATLNDLVTLERSVSEEINKKLAKGDDVIGNIRRE